MRSKDLTVHTTEGGPAAPADSALVRERRPARARARSLARRVLKRVDSRKVMVCSQCELTGGPFRPDEAAHLLRIHEQLHHGIVLHRPPLPPPA